MSEVEKNIGQVVIVDDSKIVGDMIVDVLKGANYNALYFQNGIEAIDYYKKNKKKIGLVLLDFIMPVISGFEVLKAIKEINPAVKVVMMSSFTNPEDLDNARETGIEEFISKPFSMSGLIGAVGKSFNGGWNGREETGSGISVVSEGSAAEEG